MLTLVDPNEPILWIHPDEYDKNGEPIPGATVFHIRPLTELASRKIKAAFPTRVKDGEVILNTEAIMQAVFIDRMAKIVNVELKPGAGPTTLEGREQMEKFLAHCPPLYMAPIYAAIQNSASLTETESKNSGGSPDSPA